MVVIEGMMQPKKLSMGITYFKMFENKRESRNDLWKCFLPEIPVYDRVGFNRTEPCFRRSYDLERVSENTVKVIIEFVPKNNPSVIVKREYLETFHK